MCREGVSLIVRYTVISAAVLALLIGCGVKYVKLPAREFMVTYVQMRDDFRDDTYTARMKCAKEKQTLTVVKQLKCDELKNRMEAWGKQDAAVLDALLQGGAVDLAGVWAVLEPIIKLALEIAA